MLNVKLVYGLLLGLLLTGADCKDGVGGPPPCVEDAECVAVCEAACVSDPVLSATCDEFLRACVCECEMSRMDAGARP